MIPYPCLTSPHLPLLSGNHWFGLCICESVLLYSFLHFIFLDSTCNLHIVFIVLSLTYFSVRSFSTSFSTTQKGRKLWKWSTTNWIIMKAKLYLFAWFFKKTFETYNLCQGLHTAGPGIDLVCKHVLFSFAVYLRFWISCWYLTWSAFT